MPGVNPVTKPDASISAIAGMVLLHVPVGSVLYRFVVSVVHMVGMPVIAGGNGFTVIVLVAIQPVLNV